MLNQVIHDPILRVKELAADKRGEAAMNLFVQMFDLEDDVNRIKKEMTAQERARLDVSSQAETKAPEKQAESPSLLSHLAGALR